MTLFYDHTRDRGKDVQGPTLVELEETQTQPSDSITFTAESADDVDSPSDELQAQIDRSDALDVIVDGIPYQNGFHPFAFSSAFGRPVSF